MRPKNHIIICENCGNESAKRDKGKKYCSMECRIVPIKKQMIGETFGWLTVLSELQRGEKSGKPQRRFLCKCKCGETIEKTYDGIMNKGYKTPSCGCFMHWHATNRIKHGMTKTNIYHIWANLKHRCYKKTHQSYKYYGAKGIKVCNRWKRFELFLEDMGETYREGLTLDRFPNRNGNYEPTNVRWATYKQQNRNLSTNHRITVNGITMCAVDFEDALNIRRGGLRLSKFKDAIVLQEYLQQEENFSKIKKYYESDTGKFYYQN